MKTFSRNPWQVENVHAFNFFCCPECVYQSKEESLFIYHALDNHPKSSVLFEKVPDEKENTEPMKKRQKTAHQVQVETKVDTQPQQDYIIQTVLDDAQHIDLGAVDNDQVVFLDHDQPTQEFIVLDPNVNSSDIVIVDNALAVKVEEIEDQRESMGVFPCPFCDEAYTSFAEKKEHMKTEHVDSNGKVFPVKCTNCNRAFPDPFKKKRGEVCSACQAERYGCAYCIERFPSKSMRGAHEKLTHTDGSGDLLSVNCKICDYTFGSSVLLRSHIIEEHKAEKRRHLLDGPINCVDCGKPFSSRNGLWLHRKTVHVNKDERRYKCDQCDFTTYHYKYLRDHNAMTHREKKHICEKCGTKFAYPFQLQKHNCENEVERSRPGERHECEFCGVYFRFLRFKIAHFLKVHGGMPEGYENQETFSCHYCEKLFLKQSTLQNHLQRCHDEASRGLGYCHICDQEFTEPKYLLHHYRSLHKTIPPSYEGKEQFPCEKCESVFFSKMALYNHDRKEHLKIKTKRGQQGGTLPKCPHCEKTLSDERRLRDHIANSHSEIRPYKCRSCGKGFGTKANQRYHERTVKGCKERFGAEYPQQVQ